MQELLQLQCWLSLFTSSPCKYWLCSVWMQHYVLAKYSALMALRALKILCGICDHTTGMSKHTWRVAQARWHGTRSVLSQVVCYNSTRSFDGDKHISYWINIQSRTGPSPMCHPPSLLACWGWCVDVHIWGRQAQPIRAGSCKPPPARSRNRVWQGCTTRSVA